MNDQIKKVRDKVAERFGLEVEKKATRKMKARNNPTEVWFGLGMMGLIGWSVVIPSLMGAAFGAWLDRQFPAKLSFSLVFLVAGLLLGCLNAWHWMSKQHRDMQEDPDE